MPQWLSHQKYLTITHPFTVCRHILNCGDSTKKTPAYLFKLICFIKVGGKKSYFLDMLTMGTEFKASFSFKSHLTSNLSANHFRSHF